jgi:hypothetical protein
MQKTVIPTEAGRRFSSPSLLRRSRPASWRDRFSSFFAANNSPRGLFQIQIAQTLWQGHFNPPRRRIDALANILSQRNQELALPRLHFQ